MRDYISHNAYKTHLALDPVSCKLHTFSFQFNFMTACVCLPQRKHVYTHTHTHTYPQTLHPHNCIQWVHSFLIFNLLLFSFSRYDLTFSPKPSAPLQHFPCVCVCVIGCVRTLQAYTCALCYCACSLFSVISVLSLYLISPITLPCVIAGFSGTVIGGGRLLVIMVIAQLLLSSSLPVSIQYTVSFWCDFFAFLLCVSLYFKHFWCIWGVISEFFFLFIFYALAQT